MPEINGQNPARTRDHLANERTFLAWIRTAVSLVGFGFVLVKFAASMSSQDEIFGEQEHPYANIGIGMVLFGALLALAGYYSYNQARRQIEQDSFQPNTKVNLWITITIVSSCVLLCLYILTMP